MAKVEQGELRRTLFLGLRLNSNWLRFFGTYTRALLLKHHPLLDTIDTRAMDPALRAPLESSGQPVALSGLMAPDLAVCSSAVRGLLSPHRRRKGGEEMSIFPTTILLATDGSTEAQLARTTAVDMANSTNSELHVVTVAPGYPSYDVRNPEVVEHLRRQAEDILNQQAEKIKQEGGK